MANLEHSTTTPTANQGLKPGYYEELPHKVFSLPYTNAKHFAH
jgi:hypothetical protein